MIFPICTYNNNHIKYIFKLIKQIKDINKYKENNNIIKNIGNTITYINNSDNNNVNNCYNSKIYKS